MSQPGTLGHREPTCARTRVIQSRLRGAEVTHSLRPDCAVGCKPQVFLIARGQSPSRQSRQSRELGPLPQGSEHATARCQRPPGDVGEVSYKRTTGCSYLDSLPIARGLALDLAAARNGPACARQLAARGEALGRAELR
jgi:hypothetical protein